MVRFLTARSLWDEFNKYLGAKSAGLGDVLVLREQEMAGCKRKK